MGSWSGKRSHIAHICCTIGCCAKCELHHAGVEERSKSYSHLPDERLWLCDFGGQNDAERDGVRRAGDGAGDDGSSHREGQHGVDNKHNKQEERNLETNTLRGVNKRQTEPVSFW